MDDENVIIDMFEVLICLHDQLLSPFLGREVLLPLCKCRLTCQLLVQILDVFTELLVPPYFGLVTFGNEFLVAIFPLLIFHEILILLSIAIGS